MKKIIIFAFIALVIFVGINHYNTNKAHEKIMGGTQNEYLKIRDARLAISEFSLTRSKEPLDIYHEYISIENVITYFNEISNDRKAKLNSNNTITVVNDKKNYSYDCEIVTEDCKSKIVCLEETNATTYFIKGDC